MCRDTTKWSAKKKREANKMVELEDIVNGLEGTCDWRAQKAVEYPHDDRNAKAAEILERLATEVRGMGNSLVFKQLVRAGDELSDDNKYDLLPLSEDISAYDREIGFHSFPSSGEEYLRGILEIYQEHIAKAKAEEAEEVDEAADEEAKEVAHEAATEAADEAAKEAADEAYKEAYDEAYKEAYDEAYKEAYSRHSAEGGGKALLRATRRLRAIA
jgi:hypothetical protein